MLGFPLGILSAAGAGGVAGDYELIASEILGASAASVTFSSLGDYSSTYKHLQIRWVARSDRSQSADSSFMRFNADTGSNYAWHSLRVADSSSVGSEASTSQTYMRCGRASGNTIDSNIFSTSVIDILDPYSTTKNTTIRFLSGFAAPSSVNWIELGSGVWLNTAALTSITLDQVFGSNFMTASRFSLYGLKG